jgi:hypothetical protein
MSYKISRCSVLERILLKERFMAEVVKPDRDENRTNQLNPENLSQLSGGRDKSLSEILTRIETLGLTQNLLELEVQGYTILKSALTKRHVECATAAILRRVERLLGLEIDPSTASAEDFNGMAYQHYLIFDDPIFPEILLLPEPLALMHYLLGKSCVLSSMGSHFRGPAGLPLGLHADGSSVGMTDAALVANCNYALTPYSEGNGAIAVVPGSHRQYRQPTKYENWMCGQQAFSDIAAKKLSTEEIAALQWDAPRGAVTLDLEPGDAVIWHGNTWHGGWRRDVPGVRMNLAAYFCRPHLSTQETRRDGRFQEVFDQYADEPMFAQLMGQRVFNGWREEGPDFSGQRTNPIGLYD